MTDQASLAGGLARLTEEVGRIHKSLDRIEQQVSSDRHNKTELPARPIVLLEIKERLMKEAISSARERREIWKELDVIKNRLEGMAETGRFSIRTASEIPEEQLRVDVFVDVQNIFYAAKRFNARLNFEKLLNVVVWSSLRETVISYRS